MLILLSVLIGTSDFEEVKDLDYITDSEIVMVTNEIYEYGKNIVINDACVVDSTIYLVGGSTRMGEQYGGMDAIIIAYDDSISWFKTFGGNKDDVFTGVNCDEGIIVIGESRSADFLGLSHNFFQKGFIAEFNEELVNMKVTSNSFDTYLTGIHRFNDEYFVSGYVDQDTKDFLVIRYVNYLEKIFKGNKNDVFNDLEDDSGLIKLVGATNSNEFDALSKRAIEFYIDNDLQFIKFTTYNTNKESELLFVADGFSGGYSGGEGLLIDDGVEILQNYSKLLGLTYGINNELIKISGVDDELLKSIENGEIKAKVNNTYIINVFEDTFKTVILTVVEIDSINLTINGVKSDFRMVLEKPEDNTDEYDYILYKELSTPDVTYIYDLMEITTSYTNIENTTYYEEFHLICSSECYLDDEVVESGQFLSFGSYTLSIKDEEFTFTVKQPLNELKYYDENSNLEIAVAEDINYKILVLPLIVIINALYRKWDIF